MNVKQRLKKYIESQKITIVDFEKSINVSNGYVNSISKNIGIDKINKILEIYPNLNLDWLFSGNEEMLKKDQIITVVSEQTNEYSNNENLLVEELKKQNNQQRSDIEWYKNELDKKQEMIDILLSGCVSIQKNVG
jgi:transcriptional regulator with XRE-family HTH domain